MSKIIRHRTYELVEWRQEQAPSWWIKIFVAGDLETCTRVCREMCLVLGLCVTLSKTTYIYTGGAEEGVEVGLINYVPFSSPNYKKTIMKKAMALGKALATANSQWSYTLLTPDESLFFSRRKRKS